MPLVLPVTSSRFRWSAWLASILLFLFSLLEQSILIDPIGHQIKQNGRNVVEVAWKWPVCSLRHLGRAEIRCWWPAGTVQWWVLLLSGRMTLEAADSVHAQRRVVVLMLLRPERTVCAQTVTGW